MKENNLDWMTSDVNVRVQLFGKDGMLKEEQIFHNLVTTVGKEAIANRIRSTTPASPSHIAIGAGSGGTAASTTLAGSQLERKVFDNPISQTGSTLTMETTFNAGEGTGAVTEAAVFNAASMGTMYMYADFSVINKGSSDTLKITWTLGVV